MTKTMPEKVPHSAVSCQIQVITGQNAGCVGSNPAVGAILPIVLSAHNTGSILYSLLNLSFVYNYFAYIYICM